MTYSPFCLPNDDFFTFQSSEAVIIAIIQSSFSFRVAASTTNDLENKYENDIYKLTFEAS